MTEPLDFRARDMEQTAELVRQRLQAMGFAATFCYNPTDIWLEEDGRRVSYWRWRDWYRVARGTRENLATDVAAYLTRSEEQR